MVVLISSVVFCALICIVVLFQLALAAGLPWGEYAMGGRFPGKYPPALRLASLIQILILMLLAFIVMSKSDIVPYQTWTGFGIWLVAGFSAISLFLNTITKSVWERRIWAPVSLLMLVTSLIVAIS